MDNLTVKLEESKAAMFEAQYAEPIEIVAESLKEKFGYEWTNYDTIAFGEQAKTWESYIPLFESDQTTRDNLGEVLKTKIGVVMASYSGLPIQYLGSIQPIQDEAGVIYYRSTQATTTRSGVTAGDNLVNAYGAINTNIGDYPSEEVYNDSITFATGTTSYNVSLGAGVRKGTVQISVGSGVKAIDDGQGHIVGVKIKAEASTINYTTGAITVVLSDVAGINNGDIISVIAQQDLASNVINTPGFKFDLQSKVIRANYWMLKTSFTSITDMVVRKRFGQDLMNEVTAEAANLINSSILYQAVRKLKIASVKNESILGAPITWSSLNPAGVSAYDHRRTFDDALMDATNGMYSLAGRGDVNFIIAGANGRKVLKTLGMNIVKRGQSGVHLMGFYDSIPVFFAPKDLVGDNEMLVGFRGQMWYDSPLVYAPFLPLTISKAVGTNNVFESVAGVSTAAGLDVVNPGFVVRINLV